MSMPIPRVKFIEVNSGFTPIRSSAKNRIGIVAPFSRGPAFQWRFVGGYTHFADTWGSDTSIGSLAFQGAWDQGARDFGIIRILGSGTPAQGIIRFGGVASKNNNILLHLRVIGDPVRRSPREIKSNIFSSGEYRSSVSGRYWFRVDNKFNDGGRENFTIKWIFIPLGAEGLIAWNDTSTPEIDILLETAATLDLSATQISEMREYVQRRTEEISGINTSLLEVVGHQRFTFDNRCLLLPRSGESCSGGTVEGFKILVKVIDGDMRWYWHIEKDDISNLRLDEVRSGYYGHPAIPIEGFPSGLTSTIVTDTSSGITDTITSLFHDISGLQVYIPRDSIIIPEDGYGAKYGIERGLTLQFETLNSVDNIMLEEGDSWSVRVNSDTWRIPISQGSTPNQVATSVIEVLAGDDPLGEVIRTEQDDGVIFKLMEEESGSQGNKYNYYLDLETPDGEVITEVTYTGAAAVGGEFPSTTINTIQVPIRFAAHIKDNAVVTHLHSGLPHSMYVLSGGLGYSVPTSDPNITIPPNIKVQNVVIPSITTAGPGALATVHLSGNITVVGSGQALFHFDNTAAGVISGSSGIGLTMSNYTFYQTRYMTGGVNGPRSSLRDFYSIEGHKLLSLVATSEGQWGNSLRVSLYPLTVETFNLHIIDLNSNSYDPPIAEEFYANLSFRDTDSDGQLNQLKQSKFVRGIFIPKALNENVSDIYYQKSIMRLAPGDPNETDPESPAHLLKYGPSSLKNVQLEGGYDGPPLTDMDYIKGIRILRQSPANIILTPGIHESNVIKHSLIAQAESANELEGLRIAVINAKPFLSPESANLQTQGYGSTRAVMLTGWSTYIGINNTNRFTLSPDAPYAGKLSRIPFFLSPAARTDSGPIYGISEVDTQNFNSHSQLQAYTDARLEAIHMDPNLSAFYILTGRTLTSNTQWDKVSYRRTFDIVRADLYVLLQQYKSAPLNQRLFSQISASIDAHLSSMSRNGSLRSYSGASVRSLNPASGLVEIHVGIVPVYAADYLDVYLYRDDNGNISRPQN
ncbi:hypothetical protein V6O07_00725 [Arthrospira platensis SPKY2]